MSQETEITSLAKSFNPYGEVSEEMAFAAAEEVVESRWRSKLETVKDSPAEVVETIREGKDLVVYEEGTGLNGVYRVRIEGCGEYIFKPYSEEKNQVSPEIPYGTFYRREFAAYLVDHYLGTNSVPETVIREVDGKLGSCQKLIPEFSLLDRFEIGDRNLQERLDLHGIFLLDLITWQVDRNEEGLLWVKKEDTVYAVDNALSFGKSNMFTVLSFHNEQIPSKYIHLVESLAFDRPKLEALHRELTDLLSEEEASACINRIAFIANSLLREGKVDFDLKYNNNPLD